MPKGGVGKTTTTVNLGCNLAAKGKRVLLVDIDPQGNTTQSLGLDPDEIRPTIYEVLHNPDQGIQASLIKLENGVHLLPANLDLAGAELELSGRIARESLLKEALKNGNVESNYDYVLIDAPPTLGLFPINALVAATSILVPVETNYLPWKGLKQLETTIELLLQISPNLAISGVICTKVDATTLSKSIEAQLRKRYSDLVFKTVIPKNVKLAEAPASGQPIREYDPTSTGNAAYQALAEEVEVRYG